MILTVGTKLGPTDTAQEHPALLDPTRQQLQLHIDVEPLNLAWSMPEEVSITSNTQRAR